MSSSLRRFEILLPLQFNDGSSVSDELVGQTIIELRQQFNAISSESQVIRGHGQHDGQEYRDELVHLFVDGADTPENREFFVNYKEQLKARFKQIDIWMTTYPIEVI